MRVYELAKEYNVTSKEIIETLNADGGNVKSHLSGLSNDQIVQLGYVFQSGDTIVESEYKEELAEDDDYDEKGPIDFDEEAAKENGTELDMEPGKDDWTLGSGDTVDVGDKIDAEKIQEAFDTNIKSAAEAREKMAETAKSIAEDPENWANLNATEDWDPDKNDGQLDDEEETDTELSFGQKAFAKVEGETKVEETVESQEVIVEKPKGVWGWFASLFS